MPQVGPITMWVNSTTRMPLSGRRAAGDFFGLDFRPAAMSRRAARRVLAFFAIKNYRFFCLRSGFAGAAEGSKPT
jgi:hypothetical protein